MKKNRNKNTVPIRLKNKIFISLISLSLLGFMVSLVITKTHYDADQSGSQKSSFCHISEFLDCDKALASPYAKLGPFLISELGVFYYLFLSLGFLFVWRWQRSRRETTLSFFFFLSLLALFYSLLLAYLSVTQLQTVCPLCLITYGTNFLIVLLLPRALSLSYASIPKFIVDYLKSFFGAAGPKPRLIPHLLIAFSFLIMGPLLLKSCQHKAHVIKVTTQQQVSLEDFYSIPQKTIRLENRPNWGSEKAKVEIVEFADFQCSACQKAGIAMKNNLAGFKDDVRMVFVNFPLNNTCNRALLKPIHQWACEAAIAGICANQAGQFWAYHDRVFAARESMSEVVLLEIAEDMGFDMPSFKQCLKSDDAEHILENDVEEGIRLEINVTPSIFINGRLFQDWKNQELFQKVIRSEMTR
ncbi:thioredoxin domain-containing protein [bacterium]|nr:thioredoxin domain-containing protein [bacterium]